MKIKLYSKILIVGIILSLILGSSFTSFAAKRLTGKVVIAGSSALLPLSLQGAKEFRLLNPGVQISASASSSIAGPQSASKGSAQIGACDWDATQEVSGFKAFSGLVSHKVAAIPFATIVNKSVTVENLTTEQLQGIYKGSIKNWSEVGGSDAPIIVINRAFGSGTRVNYQMKALKNSEFMKPGENPNYKEVKSSGDMKTAVQTTPNSIGYIDLVYVKGDLIKALKYNGVEATTTNVINGKYPVWGFGYYLTKGEPTGATKAFIEYVQSKKFQQGSVKKMKFIPISSMK